MIDPLQAILLIVAVMLALCVPAWLWERYQARWGKPLEHGRDQWNTKR